MSLNAPSVSALALETTTLNLWEEFLKGWFDGGSHAVGTAGTIAFPLVALRFQQSGVPQPLNSTAITMTWNFPGHPNLEWQAVSAALPAAQQIAVARVTWLFWIRAAAKNIGTGSAAMLCRETAEKLFAVLQNARARRSLHEKGILHLRPETPALVSEGHQGDAAYSMRLVTCRGQVRYHVLSQ